MKEAIGNSFLIMIATTFLFIIMGMLVTALTFSKAYKAKNKIVNVIEKYNSFSSDAKAEADYDLYKMSYKVNTTDSKCDKIEGATLVHDTNYGAYDYCVYKIWTSRGKYYHVVTYTQFDIPIIGEQLIFKVYGDSRTIYQELVG